MENAWPGFAAQRNVAIDHARSEWILEVDADERVSPELGAEIVALLAGPPPPGIDVCAIPRRNRFLGADLAGSARYPEYRTRLFRRTAYRHDEGRSVHEGLWPKGPVHVFEGELDHVLAGSLREAIKDAWTYSRLEAHQARGRPTVLAALVGIVARPLAKAAYRLVVYEGWRDGWRGWLKVGLDSLSDAVVWVRRLRMSAGTTEPVAAHGAHFATAISHGSVRIAGVAAGADATRRTVAWLAAARDAGADVVLITDSPSDAARAPLRVRAVPRLGPLLTLRALDAENQARPLDAVVPAGRRERLLIKALPAHQRGSGRLDLSLEPAAAERKLRAMSRSA